MVIFNLVTFLHVPRDQQTIIEPSPKFKEQEGKVYVPYFTDEQSNSLKIDVFSFLIHFLFYFMVLFAIVTILFYHILN